MTGFVKEKGHLGEVPGKLVMKGIVGGPGGKG